MDEERLYALEQNLKETTEAAAESEKRYDEVPLLCRFYNSYRTL